MKEEQEELRNLQDKPGKNLDSELHLLDMYLAQGKLEHPSAQFTQRVMHNLHSTAVVQSALPSRKSMLILVGILAALGIAILLLAGGAFESVTTLTVDQTLVPNKNIREHIPSIPFNGKLVINIVILMNLALAFTILDRAVLRPWFNRRAKMNY